ncbi:SH2 domain-containing adapter protein F isoform X8 [Myiozetetes cayanensis]|uniref:SH2 domain-containing adapter protein F isoform X8 n=1 Tax=Myiozetetes cayanensis TaxID=478635 RepID=UPI002160BA65|nr:SH2 domain-containing adapter protein F isoform X8 [Myiozetetes cayanensis]
MEPYEAQKMMAEIRQKGLREAPARPLHLYDTPYEPVQDIDSERPTCPWPRESRLPEDDERPPEEYDQPWEWKKERISKAFAGRNKTSSAVSGTQVLAERSSREGSAQRMPRQPSASRMQKAGASGKNTGGGNST